MPAGRRPCEVDGCDRPRTSRGWCSAHYARWRTTGDVQADVPVKQFRIDRRCSIDGCDRPAHQRSMCSLHYTRWRTGRSLTAPPAPNAK
jgi:hypothetical protein